MSILDIILSLILSIMTYIPIVNKYLTKNSKITIKGFLAMFGFSLVFAIIFWSSGLIPTTYVDCILILFITIFYSAYIYYKLSYFFSPLKFDIMILNEYDIHIPNDIYAMIRYFKEECKYNDKCSKYIFWILSLCVITIGIDLAILFNILSNKELLNSLLNLWYFIFMFLLYPLSITINFINIKKVLSPVQYYVKYKHPLTEDVYEGFKLDRNTLYNDGKIIDIPPDSKIIEELTMKKYLGDQIYDQNKTKQALKELNRIDIFLWLWNSIYRVKNGKWFNKKVSLLLIKRKIAKNNKVWSVVEGYLKNLQKNKEDFQKCYSKIQKGENSTKEILEFCIDKKIQGGR